MTERERRGYEAEVRRQVRRIEGIEDQQVRKVVGLLRASRAQIIERLATGPSDYAELNLEAMKNEVTRILNEFRSAYAQTVPDLLIDIEDAASSFVTRPLARIGTEVTFGAMSSEVTSVLSTFHAGQIKAVSDDAIRKIDFHLQTGIFGGVPKADLLRNVASVLPGPSTAGSIANRAERIVRTEVNRMHAQMTHRRLEQAVKIVPNLRKWWLTAGDGRVRESHYRAGIDFGQTAPVGVDQPFMLAGMPAMYPRDPMLPAAEVVNCRCRQVPIIAETVVDDDGEVVPAKPVFETQRTAKAASEYGRRMGFATGNYDLAAMDVNAANEINRAMFDMTVRDGMPPVKSVQFFTRQTQPPGIGSSTWADAAFWSGRIRIFSPVSDTLPDRMAKTAKAYAERNAKHAVNVARYKQQIADGTAPDYIKKWVKKMEKEPMAVRHNVGSGPYDVMVHEYGHIIHGMMPRDAAGWSKQTTGYKVLGGTSRSSNAIIDGRLGAKMKREIRKVSDYAATNTQEVFAECFAAMNAGEGHLVPEPIREFVREVIENAKKVQREANP